MKKIAIILLFFISSTNAEIAYGSDANSKQCEFLLERSANSTFTRGYEKASAYAVFYDVCVKDAIRLSTTEFKKRWGRFERTVIHGNRKP